MSRLFAGVLVMLVSGAARANDLSGQAMRGVPGNPSGIEVGVGALYAVPLGSIADGFSLSDRSPGAVPLQLDLGYRSNWLLFQGIYFSYAPGLAPGTCSTCSAFDLHAGLQLAFHSPPGTRAFSPWGGLFFGAEFFHQSESTLSVDSTARGIEAGVKFGVDWRVGHRFSVGPMLTASLGEFFSSSSSFGDANFDGKAMHGWFGFGFHGSFQFIDDDDYPTEMVKPVDHPLDR